MPEIFAQARNPVRRYLGSLLRNLGSVSVPKFLSRLSQSAVPLGAVLGPDRVERVLVHKSADVAARDEGRLDRELQQLGHALLLVVDEAAGFLPLDAHGSESS